MKKILLSINPEFVAKILDRTKQFEYRTKVTKQDIKAMLIYCTYPTQKVVAEVKIKSILTDTPENLWKRTKNFSGISKEFFDNYFKGRTVAYAYELGSVTKFNQPKTLESYGINFAPQSFVYVNR